MELLDRLQSTLGSAYSVERELGGGGMSRVFVAHENALGRKVVVKMLGENLLEGLSSERFAREVKLAASLQHPNIVPLLTTGVADGIPYFTMPYVKGESLRALMREAGTVPRRRSISILRDLARALQYAHGEGVIHRDIKPENILLSGDAAVVTDFGIAKAISAARTSHSGEPGTQHGLTLTQAGTSIGTPAYMAPEQVAGDTIDHRIDIYAWGIIAYELLSGAHPFAGKTTAAQLFGAHLTQVPDPLGPKAPGISPSLADVVMRCLSKSPDDRPASAGDLLDSLEGTSGTHPHTLVARSPVNNSRRRNTIIASTLGIAALLAVGAYAYTTRQPKTDPPTSRGSVAVLPFEDDQADSASAYFGEGIADELTTELGKVEGLRVASRTSSVAISKRRDLDVREIGRMLGVSTVVEGTVRRSGGKLRVSARLTDAKDGLTLWNESYDRENKDVFAVQDDITRAIVAALRPELAGGGRSATRGKAGTGTSNTEAYDLYLRGTYLLERRGVARSAEYFTQAIQKDSMFARAYGGLASALEFFPYFTGVPAQRVESRARAAAEHSLLLDPTLAESRIALAMVHWHANRLNEADAEFKLAIAADSTNAAAHTQYARYLLSSARVDDALRELLTARRLDPLSAVTSVWLSRTFTYAGDAKSALEESKRALELDPTLLPARTVLVFDMVSTGRNVEARKVIGDFVPHAPFNGMVANILERAGDKNRAAMIRKSLNSTPDTVWEVHTGRALAYLALSDTAKVLTEMEAAVAHGEMLTQMIPFVDAIYDPLRRSPRFAAVVRNVGLEGRGFTSPKGGRLGQ